MSIANPVHSVGRVERVARVRVADADRREAAQRVVLAGGGARPPLGARVEADLAEGVDDRVAVAQHERVVAVEPAAAGRLVGERRGARAGERVARRRSTSPAATVPVSGMVRPAGGASVEVHGHRVPREVDRGARRVRRSRAPCCSTMPSTYSLINSSVGAASAAVAGAAASPIASSDAAATVTATRWTECIIGSPCLRGQGPPWPPNGVRLREAIRWAEGPRGEEPVNSLRCADARLELTHICARRDARIRRQRRCCSEPESRCAM